GCCSNPVCHLEHSNLCGAGGAAG
nr:Chain A, Alpha-conotoxin MII [synthetic construct]